MNHRDNAFSLPIRIPYQVPKKLRYFIAFTHAGALLCLFPIALPLWLRALCMILVVINYLRLMRSFDAGQSVENRPCLLLKKNDEWFLLDADGDVIALSIRNGAFVHRLLLVLRFVAENGKSYCFILSPDNVDHNTLRRLRVRLRHGNSKVDREQS